jgi:hypothetical protein
VRLDCLNSGRHVGRRALEVTVSKVVSNSAKLAFIRDHYIDAVIGKEICPVVTSVPYTNNPLAVVSDHFFGKATKTLDAICVLCKLGFAEDALILGRTIFEQSVYLKTIALPDSVEQRQIRATSFIYDRDHRQRVERLKKWQTLKAQGKCLQFIAPIEAQNPELQSVPEPPENFVPLKNFERMAVELGEPWECWYHFLYASLSTLVHPSGSGSSYIRRNLEHDEEISQALSISVTMHYYLTDAVLTLLNLESYRPSLEQCMKDFIAQVPSGVWLELKVA